ncbi:MAG TPA: translocation/assembly module TamB domain-containing protein [Cyclobacteriaceae bacterium]|nr:translocation/assembly module TamB domain-containing protein [Cyclobacteriaceae bacterium]HNU40895.1 translocation/assembly module TamB domain-containing protein [Cyclobacteriaceae bacterium]
MKPQVIKNRVFLWLKRVLLYTTYSLLIFVTVSFFLLQIPAVQKSIAQRVTENFTKLSAFTINYARIHLVWYDRLEITDLTVTDPAGNPMIGTEKLLVNFSLSTLLSNNNINLDAVILDGADLKFYKINKDDSIRDLNINLFIAEINKQFKGGGGQGNAKHINIGEILIYRTGFKLHDDQKDSIRNAFDYNHINLFIDEAQANNFKVIGDTIELKLNTLIGEEKNCTLPIRNLSTFFRLSQTGMDFLNIHAQIGESKLSDTVRFKYTSLADLNDFNNKVNLQASLRNTIIYPNDLAQFTPGIKPLPRPIEVSGNVSGRINRLTVQNMELQSGDTHVAGKLQLDGLPVLGETFINLDLKAGDIFINDLGFLFPNNINNILRPLGKFKFVGKFTGFIDDFVANGNFRGSFGQIISDINLKIDQQHINQSTYSGNLNLNQFDLGIMFNDTTLFQKVTLAGRINGKGLTQETADFNLNGKIHSIGIRHYNYTNIATNARFARELFNGIVSIDDPNLQLRAFGGINIRPGQQVIKVKAQLDTLLTKPIGLTRDHLFIKSDLDVDIKGLKLDSLFGSIRLSNNHIELNEQAINIEKVSLTSSIKDSVRNLTLSSSFADAQLNGVFYFSSLFGDLQKLSHEFQLNLSNDKEALVSYYKQKPKNGEEYQVNFSMDLKNINPLLQLFNLPVTISNETSISGAFTNGYTSRLQAFSRIDTISYSGKYFIDNEIDFSGSKIRDSTTVLAVLSIESQRQQFSKKFATRDLFAEAVWNKDHIDLGLDFDQEGTTNYVRLQSEIDFLADSTKIKILPSRLNILEESWQINTQNYTLVKGNEWQIHNLKLFHNNESVLVNGAISKDSSEALVLSLSGLNLQILNSISPSALGGIIDGFVEVKGLYNDFALQNNLTIKNLEVDKFLVGDVTGTTLWDHETSQFLIDFYIDRQSMRTLNLSGSYNPSNKKSPLFINATLEETHLKIIEPFLKGIFSKIEGTLTGKYQITGKFAQPLIEGEGKIVNGQIMIDYLKTLYTFDGTLAMTPTKIIFNDFTLYDPFKNKGVLDGYLTHRNYARFRINLDASFTNLQLLNTTSKDNSLFYGQAYGSGNLNMLGPLNNMKISATARTSKNTRIFIPISGSESVEKSEFINFVHFSDTIQIADKKESLAKNNEPSGIILDLNLDITPDAYTEIIFDIKAGDIIRGYGYGDIKLQIDTKGEFNMFGLYEFEQGYYNFTLYDIINKEFSITKGSRISWYGDPYGGVLDLHASYRQMASLGPILPDQSEETQTSSQVRRKYPVEVLLELDGPMLSPQIAFDIDAKNLPDNITADNGNSVQLNFAFKAFKAKLDEQELKRQVFSLIILRRFSPPDAFSTSGSISNSVSELLSNQLSYWLTQVDQNLEIDLDIGAMDQEAFNTFQLRLSYSFLNGRLRVTRDGTFGNQTNQSDVANMIGDWTIDYMLTPDGKFKVKMYSRSNFNQLTNTLGTQASVTTGVSLLHTQSFNNVKDLLRITRDRRRKQLNLTPDTQMQDDETE